MDSTRDSYDLTLHFIDPAEVAGDLAEAGFALVARTDRESWPGVEAPTRRCHLLCRRAALSEQSTTVRPA